MPAITSSSITPNGSPRRSARPTSQGFQMSNRRNSTNAATQPGHRSSIDTLLFVAPIDSGSRAIHWPTTSSATISEGS